MLSRYYGESNAAGYHDGDQADYINNIDGVLEGLPSSYPERGTNPTALYSNIYVPTIDNHSIMFEVDDNGSSCLFLSDADDATIEAMLIHNNLRNKSYYLIKSAHHGTRGARPLTAHNIQGEITVNCCGPAHGHWWGPYAAYTNVSKTVICTDWKDGHRKWVDKNKHHVMEKCCLQIYS